MVLLFGLMPEQAIEIILLCMLRFEVLSHCRVCNRLNASPVSMATSVKLNLSSTDGQMHCLFTLNIFPHLEIIVDSFP